ncbi:hypothetical protein Taro_023574 [Colocasia esculenta]|uniref:Uncharacterized protein n=1 Tax=Colocasia esculenta TaxID=4460 RepID=A0A843V452_COLES|nr:hypothetical protein [Colocasia esculenta]
MCAKAKETYGGLDKKSLIQSGVFPMERWSIPRKLVGKGHAPKPRRLTEALARSPWSSQEYSRWRGGPCQEKCVENKCLSCLECSKAEGNDHDRKITIN